MTSAWGENVKPESQSEKSDKGTISNEYHPIV